MYINGKILIENGLKPGKYFGAMIEHANKVIKNGGSLEVAIAECKEMLPPPPLNLMPPGYTPFFENIIAKKDFEVENLKSVKAAMEHVMRSPVVKSGAIMPDACPTGPSNIPVGGVVASEGLTPGMHSADICCSMAVTVLKRSEYPSRILDFAEKISHFGPKVSASRNRDMSDVNRLISKFENNYFLKGLETIAQKHYMTQGDGNHFFFVGASENTGKTYIITHHGSRGLGAQLYKRGISSAVKNTNIVCPKIDKQNAWLELGSRDEEEYWKALQHIRTWTKMNHFGIHNAVAKALGNKIEDQFWNEHNFVFRKTDGLFYHAKGATPAFPMWADDAREETIIPLNMNEPILIVKGSNNPNGLGFSPHGAGRNMSRTRFKKEIQAKGLTDQQVFENETNGIDARFYCGKIDISELPSAYKNAQQMQEQIEHFKLAEIVDRIQPQGSIMAGDWESEAPWRNKKKK